MAKIPKGCTKGRKYYHCPITPAPKCARGSIRTVKSGKNLIRICCPSGKWDSKKKRCKVGTKGLTKLIPI